MKITKYAATLGVVASLFTSTIASAEATRSAASMPAAAAVSGRVVSSVAGMRASRNSSEQSNLLGAPLLLGFLGLVVVVGTVIIISKNGKHDSFGG